MKTKGTCHSHQVELAVGRAFEYRGGRATTPRPAVPSPAPSPRPPPRPAPFIRRAFPPRPPPTQYRAPAPNATVVARARFPSPSYSTETFPAPPPPPYRQAAPRPRTLPQRVTPEDLQALLPPPTTSMDQKTQSSFQVLYMFRYKVL